MLPRSVTYFWTRMYVCMREKGVGSMEKSLELYFSVESKEQ